MTKPDLIRLLAAVLLLPGLLLGSNLYAKSEPLQGPAPDFTLPLAGKKKLKLVGPQQTRFVAGS